MRTRNMTKTMARILPPTLALCMLFSSAATAQDETNGGALFQKYCAVCHGTDLRGGNAQSLVDGIWNFGEDSGSAFASVMNGVTSRGMPAFGTVLNEDEIRSLVSFIRSSEKDVGAVQPPPPASFQTLDYEVKVTILDNTLMVPWAIAFPDERTMLVTERAGRLRVFRDGELQPEPVADTPEVFASGQGGLMDVALDPQYAENGWVYLSYSHALTEAEGSEPLMSDAEENAEENEDEDEDEEERENAEGGDEDGDEDNSRRRRRPEPPAMTRIVRGRIQDNTWVDQEVVFEAKKEHYVRTDYHYGSRIVFDPAGYLYFSIGERGQMMQSLDPGRPVGKIHRVWPDGSIPVDNPFVYLPDADPSAYTLGNRNPQGLSVHPVTGRVWETEHGPMGGDELNVITPGGNYGWPAFSYGVDYSGEPVRAYRDDDGNPVNAQLESEGMAKPAMYWRPSTGVCGIEFYNGHQFPKWQGALLVGSLAYRDVRLLQVRDDRVIHEELIWKNQGRVRDIGCGPDGAIYLVLGNRESPGMLIRLSLIAERKYGPS